MFRKSINKNVLRTALEVAAEEAYTKHLQETGKNIHPDRAGDHRIEWIEEKMMSWTILAEKRIG